VTSDNLSSAHSAAAPIASLLLNTAVWGTSWWAFRQLDAQGLHSLWATTLVYVISTLVLLAGRPSSLRALAAYPALIWLGLAAGLTNASFNWGVLLGEVVRVVLLFYLMPVWARRSRRPSSHAHRWLSRERPWCYGVLAWVYPSQRVQVIGWVWPEAWPLPWSMCF
jgi:hypothetical protein